MKVRSLSTSLTLLSLAINKADVAIVATDSGIEEHTAL